MVLSRIIDGGLKVLDQERLVQQSVLFDPDWYASQHKVKGGSDKALGHFLKHKGRFDPGPGFSCSAYLSDNPDVREAGLNPLLHYLRFGKDEGRIVRDIYGRLSGESESALGENATARLRQLFDARFYLETNPDLSGHDGFDHFMAAGWRQRRDPAPWFSIEGYMIDHPDIAGKNPFAHYVLHGAGEGRSVRKSRRQRVTDLEDKTGRLSVTAVAMIKNEADIIALFASHLLALFDNIVIVDHQSEDGTAEYLKDLTKAYPRVEVLQLLEPSYIQSVTMTHVVRDRPAVREADWVFFLDADEFLPFESRAAFHAALEPLQRCPVVSLHWTNLIPKSFWADTVSLDTTTQFLIPPAPSPFQKIAFQPSRFNLDQIVVAQGNHTLIETLNGLEIPSFKAAFPLLHIPIRSVDQLLLKLNQGVLAYQKIGRSRDAGQGTHWYRMKEATADQTISHTFLNAMAVRYSEENQSLDPLETSDLIALGYAEGSIEIATEDIDVSLKHRRGLGEMLMRLYATDFDGAATSDEVSATRLDTCDHQLVRAKDNTREYGALPPVDTPSIELFEAMAQFLPPSYRDIEDLVPSDWSGHIPLMFALVALIKPRRYVELGTLKGASFFAFAQAAADSKLDSKAIAVSSWSSGDTASEQQSFETFEFIASKYADRIGVLRMGYSAAAQRFDDGSIDLLHLDGFGDATSLDAVLAEWLPKLSSSGVLLLHDINAQNRKNAVWRVWDRLRQSYPTLEFRHDQGLGVACCGSDCASGLLALAEGAKTSPALKMVLQDHFAQQGHLAAELFSRRYDMAQAEVQLGSTAALTEELAWHKQELSAKQAELDEVRALLRDNLQKASGA